MINNFISVLIITLLITGCSTTTNRTLKRISEPQIETQLIVGQTTKKDITMLYGQPYDIEVLPKNEERWVYEIIKKVAKPLNFVPIVSLFLGGTDNETQRLKIYFNESGYLTKYILSTHEGETNTGLIQ